jgi:hypothetical protein
VKTDYKNLQVTWNGTDSTLASATAWQTADGVTLSNESFIANDSLVFGTVGNKSINVGTAATVSGLTVDAAGYTFGGEKLTGTTTAKDADYTATGALLVTATGSATFDNALDLRLGGNRGRSRIQEHADRRQRRVRPVDHQCRRRSRHADPGRHARTRIV